METSATGVTVVVSESELLLETGSLEVAATVAVFVIVPPAAGAVTVIVMGGAGPTASEARVQTTFPEDRLQVQPVPVAETKGAVFGRSSVTVRPAAASGPLFVTVSV